MNSIHFSYVKYASRLFWSPWSAKSARLPSVGDASRNGSPRSRQSIELNVQSDAQIQNSYRFTDLQGKSLSNKSSDAPTPVHSAPPSYQMMTITKARSYMMRLSSTLRHADIEGLLANAENKSPTVSCQCTSRSAPRLECIAETARYLIITRQRTMTALSTYETSAHSTRNHTSVKRPTRPTLGSSARMDILSTRNAVRPAGRVSTASCFVTHARSRI